jgi:hypothetical protein
LITFILIALSNLSTADIIYHSQQLLVITNT